jgi:cytoskeletal protein CcmA (bactofilin family)
VNGRNEGGVIGPQLVVRGRLDGEGDLRVDGVFEGELAIRGALEIGPDGTVSGPVQALRIDVAGELQGNVQAGESIAIRAGGRVLGDVRAKLVSIDDGAALHGGIDMEFEPSDRQEPGR